MNTTANNNYLIHNKLVNHIYGWLAETRDGRFEVELIDKSGEQKTVVFCTTRKVEDFGSNYSILSPDGLVIYAMMYGSPYEKKVVVLAFDQMYEFWKKNSESDRVAKQNESNAASDRTQMIRIKDEKEGIRISIPQDLFEWLQKQTGGFVSNGIRISSSLFGTLYNKSTDANPILYISAPSSILENRSKEFRSDITNIKNALLSMKEQYYCLDIEI